MWDAEAVSRSARPGALDPKPDEEGFLYPKVEEEQCIRCGKCLRHCPVLFRREEERQPEMYGVRNKNAEHCSRSASAGVADMAAREMIAAEGSVFGCAYTDEWKAEHREIKAEKDLWKIQSSKYVQSDIGRCYETAKARLKEGEKGAVYRNSLSDRKDFMPFLVQKRRMQI